VTRNLAPLKFATGVEMPMILFWLSERTSAKKFSSERSPEATVTKLWRLLPLEFEDDSVESVAVI
jgi:hypothetical protein